MRRFFQLLFKPARFPCYLSPVLSAIQFRPAEGLDPRADHWVWGIPLLRLKRRFLQPIVTERIVEIPFVLRHLPPEPGAKVLDFGCAESPLSLEMASIGYRVTGVDLRPYPYRHPNLTFVQGDFLKWEAPEGSFDAVVALSSLEHCGLAAYGAKRAESGDLRAMQSFHRLLRPGGRLLLTVPYGLRGEGIGQRVYDGPGLVELLQGFRMETARYFRSDKLETWVEVRPEDLASVDSHSGWYTRGAALILAVKS